MKRNISEAYNSSSILFFIEMTNSNKLLIIISHILFYFFRTEHRHLVPVAGLRHRTI